MTLQSKCFCFLKSLCYVVTFVYKEIHVVVAAKFSMIGFRPNIYALSSFTLKKKMFVFRTFKTPPLV